MANLVCSVNGCVRKIIAMGYCQTHYLRFKKNGSPGSSFIIDSHKGKARRFYEDVVLTHQFGDDSCLTWPFNCNECGYGTLWQDGKKQITSRLLCEDTYGPPPSPQHQTAHRCGNGHMGCVNRHHLRWETPKGNSADRFLHGTDPRGIRNPSVKIMEDHVREIRALAGKLSQSEIGDNYGVSRTLVGAIHRGEAWGWLK